MASVGAQQGNGEENVIMSLPKERGWGAAPYFYLFQDFWCPSNYIQGVFNFQKFFQTKEDDVFVASFPKSGTTWLKALTFAIVKRQHFASVENHPLLTSIPHALVPSPELTMDADIYDQIGHLSQMTEPRVVATHIPYPSLPKSIMESSSRIIYICRNPFDTFVSAWTFSSKANSASSASLTLEEAFEMFCKGIVYFGPWWSHMLSYWQESKTNPNKVLFLKYEDLKEDINFQVKRIAEFLGCPFSEEEESNGVMESIIKLCSFEKMKDLDVNKFGSHFKIIDNKHFFRKAEIGDWINYFSPSMVEKLSKVIEQKLSGSGLSFKIQY
ncbi:hypothetical protein VNO78_06961 [Psophocarpus tetragonolobus]|uniref:Sulfotransferase n=1 Tax=Psophocarpus tetragonolobus TaxID=3891 RepID=A0AAN9XRV0_PSOTE